VDQEYLGDSYDLVKRFFGQVLHEVAPLYADPTFVPEKIRTAFTKVTCIPIFQEDHKGDVGVLLDPTTGVPREPDARSTTSHASLAYIIEAAKESTYVICFDQSYYRTKESTKKEQRANKLKFLKDQGFSSFYYASHAPFLFVARKKETLNLILKWLREAGIPENMLEQ
jgi:hypothetical protein